MCRHTCMPCCHRVGYLSALVASVTSSLPRGSLQKISIDSVTGKRRIVPVLCSTSQPPVHTPIATSITSATTTTAAESQRRPYSRRSACACLARKQNRQRKRVRVVSV
eukprot:GHVS01077996.1.p1 GENE.GHVS01077996.1~~GHVS01077996.1.p1  ORF type:complete len:108 (+),score=4.54 GHVS01077996.1:399-722(+)